jgi:hypothetical protein
VTRRKRRDPATPLSVEREQLVEATFPVAAIVVGALFVLLAIIRPSFAWDVGKVQQGRAWIGETGMIASFVVLGVVLMGLGAILWRRR